MRMLAFGVLISLALLAESGRAAGACMDKGGTRFICGTANSEDLVPLPGARWVIGSGVRGPGVKSGGLFVIDAQRRVAERQYPGGGVGHRLDHERFGGCSGPPEPDTFDAGGLNVRRTSDDAYTLYVAHHGARETIEIFDIEADDSRFEMTWVGCIAMPALDDSEHAWPANSVAPLADGSIAVTANPPVDRSSPDVLDKVTSGKVKGRVLIWGSGIGWREVPGVEFAGANGIEVSADERWLFVNASFEPGIHRLPLRQPGAEHAVIKTRFNPDNMRWGDDGFLYVTGPTGSTKKALTCAASSPSCPIGFKVLRVNPGTLESEEVVSDRGSASFGFATGVAKVGDEVWVSSARGTRVSTYLLKATKVDE